MTLEDFEKSLAQSRSAEDRSEAVDTSKKRRHHHHHRSSRSQHSSDRDEDRHRHRHKRSRRFDDEPNHIRRDRHSTHASSDPEDNDEWVEKEVVSVNSSNDKQDSAVSGAIQRDSWMEAPSSHEVHVRKAKEPQPEKMTAPSSHPAPQLKIHKNELNIHLQGLAAGKEIDDIADEPAQREVDYAFGDSGSQWRMTKLKGVLRQAEDTGRSVEDIAVERYGDLRAFDEAREEQIELDRRETYGSGYVGKEKPGGELFQERNLQMNLRRDHTTKHPEDGDMDLPQAEVIDTQPAPTKTVQMDQTALNRLKAQMMKAKLRGSPDLPALEAEYSLAMSTMSNRKASDVVVLGAMENRMLAGGRRGEVKATDNKRGRERGLVEENEDMSIEDMVREERRTKGQAGGDGQRFAERIAKDAKFDNDLDYLDENASKLAKRVQKSEVNLKNTAISDFQKMSRILDNCPLCHHEDKDLPPMAPLVSLATRVYLTLPTDPEISEGGACIVPIQHRGNLLECDDDEWEEIRNFMKSLTRMYHDQGRDVLFYENAASPQKRRHAAMEVVPLPYSLGETAPAFFKEAILSSDEEWTQHKKIIDTLTRARDQGLGKLAFRRSLAKEMPYFHVWFAIDGGLGHIVEDSNRWPKGDLFAREVIGGMLDVEPQVIKQQGRWKRGTDRRLEGFQKRWRKFDWTRVLTSS